MAASFQSSLFQVAEVQLIYKTKVKASDRPQITTSASAYEILFNHWDPGTIEHIESFKILLLNRANWVLGISNISSGGISGTVADPKVIFQSAIKANASGIVLSHNHPSGNLKPSQADLQLTEKIREGGKILEITIIDHLIITSESYLSFADEGYF